jgi:hypothetical protein
VLKCKLPPCLREHAWSTQTCCGDWACQCCAPPPPRLLALYHHNKNQGSDWDPPTFPVVVGSSERAWVSLERMHALLCLCILAAPPPPLTQSRGGAGRGGAADLPAFCPGDLGTTSGT